jgi:hypothetical protein
VVAVIPNLNADLTTAFSVALADGQSGQTCLGACFCFVCQPEAGESHADQADPEFLERLPPADGLGHAFGEFIEFVIHTFPFVLWFVGGLSLTVWLSKMTAGASRIG